ncbi:hypothetical protein [Dyadobacter sp. NIV53]|uniref:hypothetical protein n=1 Tax=Dyadobacter sp. NIV53 TaxID=2861765 RepID=UPI001C88E199|nr:hypothetical protein [Dyadobacter sp. NIV53]
MKNLTKIALPALLFVSGITYAQTTTTPSTPLNSQPSTPSTGNPSEDTLIKGKKPGMAMDTTNKSTTEMKADTTSKTPNSTGTTNSSDTTANPRKPND